MEIRGLGLQFSVNRYKTCQWNKNNKLKVNTSSQGLWRAICVIIRRSLVFAGSNSSSAMLRSDRIDLDVAIGCCETAISPT